MAAATPKIKPQRKCDVLTFALATSPKSIQFPQNFIIKPMKPELKFESNRQRVGFTLVEMLVVIAIMSILMTAGAIGLGGMGGKGVTSGVASAEGLFDEARATAVGKNLRSCILVAKTLTNNKGDDLRRVIVAYEETEKTAGVNFGKAKNPTSVTPNWEISSRGVILPDQTFFSKKYSKKVHPSGGDIEDISDSRIVDANGAALRSTSPYKGSYYIYEFNSEGICKTPGASFVVGSGARNLTKSSTEQPPKVTAAGKRDFGGFVVWRNGRTSVFRSPEQVASEIKSLDAGKEF